MENGELKVTGLAILAPMNCVRFRVYGEELKVENGKLKISWTRYS